MSTTDTAPDEPRRLKIPFPFRRSEGRAPGLGRTAPGAPRGRVPLSETREGRRLLDQAENAGRRAAAGGTLDPYVLGSGRRLPYFGRLQGMRDHTRGRVLAEHHEREERELRASAELYADTAARVAEARRARDSQEEETRRRHAAAARLDRTATRMAAREDRRDRLLPWIVARSEGRRRPDGPDPDPHPEPGTDGPGSPAPAYPAAQGEDAGLYAPDERDGDPVGNPAARPAPAAGAPWEGLTETSAMARWPRRFLTLLLILVELPVYLGVFLAIHDGTPEGRASAFLLTAAVGVAMTLGPFQAGRQWRRRGATAALWLVLPVAAALLTLWGWAAWYLGDLRARIVFRDTDTSALAETARQLGVDLPPAPTLLDQLHLDEHTVSVTFIALLLLSGGIAFLLAVSEEHPFIAAYRLHGDRLAKAEQELARAEAAVAAAQREQGTLEERRTERARALAAELTAVDNVFEAAAHAYLDGVQAASRDPAVTEGAMRLSTRYPLLPELPVRR
ncbi:hypothetical protein [Streptomyces griseoruber]|uniref:Uncharacterized protein n=1 Tax=Streptomyces griseoruber TaxID=1943 RepID=A0A101SL10_9ACTN|nr:hypothetical protein [Streptomyces griseoruber]KUN76145.1 hypothetical protein AQJ64_39105 [Streptomyces griseoruber]